LQHIDADTFGRYCNNFGRWVKLQKRLDEEGETYTSESPHGTSVRSHPAFMIADRLDRALERAEANFALNPADRQRLFAARAAAAGAGAGAGGADLFGQPVGAGAGGKAGSTPAEPDQPKRAIGFLN
jgi:P27 family predicted phage terminase small subunit